MSNTANKFLTESLYAILDHGMSTQSLPHKVRTRYQDGTPAHYISIGPSFVVYDIENGDVPINTLRGFPMKKAIAEIRWIYQLESNNIALAEEMGVDWWKPWDIGDGTIGQRYGATVNKYNLMYNLIYTFISDPLSRRKMMSLWQEQDFIDDPKGLKPCAHTTLWDLNIRPDGTYAVTLTLYQRSMDLLITSSINAFQYWILGEALMAYLRYNTGYNYRLVKLRHDIGDVHIYDRHIDAAKEVLRIEPGAVSDIGYIVPQFIKDWYRGWTEDDFTIIRPKIPKLQSLLELAI